MIGSMLTWRGAVLLRISSLRRRIGHDWRVFTLAAMTQRRDQICCCMEKMREKAFRPRTRNVE